MLCVSLTSFAGETYSLNADWRFMKAPETIPLDQAKASVEKGGAKVEDVSLVVKPGKVYLTLPYYNNLKTVGTYVAAKDFDFEKGEATICVKAEVRNEDISRRGAEIEDQD